MNREIKVKETYVNVFRLFGSFVNHEGATVRRSFAIAELKVGTFESDYQVLSKFEASQLQIKLKAYGDNLLKSPYGKEAPTELCSFALLTSEIVSWITIDYADSVNMSIKEFEALKADNSQAFADIVVENYAQDIVFALVPKKKNVRAIMSEATVFNVSDEVEELWKSTGDFTKHYKKVILLSYDFLRGATHEQTIAFPIN